MTLPFELQQQANALEAAILNQVATGLATSKKPEAQPEPGVAQPDSNGEFASPADGAIWMAVTYGIPQTPLKGKAPFLQNWPAKASADPAQIRAWATEHPGCNFGSVAIAGKHFIFEADSTAVRERFKNQGHDFTSNLIIESSPGKGHRYYLSAPGVANVGQNKGEDFSIRANGEQCVSPGSVHPVTGRQYRVAAQNGPLTQPTSEEIAFWNSERAEKKKPIAAGIDEPIPEGQRNSTIASILGKARQNTHAGYEVLIALARQHNERCVPPLPDSELQATAHSIARYEAKPAPPVILNGKEMGQPAVATTIEIPKFETPGYPKFPTWIFKGCHVYDSYIKEVCEKNCRYPEMMFVPALAITLNYLGTKCHMARRGRINGSMVNIIGRKGRVIKSTSVQDMFDYYEHVGVFNHYGSSTRNAEGKSLCWTAGSTEGVGVSAKRVNCQNIILYFDELKTLSDKAGIEGSSMGGHLLSMLQSGKYANGVKSQKGGFEFDPGSYTASVITCCTDRMFVRYWSRLIAFSDGLEDRATLILQPEQLKDVTPRVYVPASPEAIEREKQLLDKAIAQQSYEFEDDTNALEAFAKKYGNRSEIRAEEWAVAFAVQMGKDTVDSGCIERGIALETYNIQVKKYLNVREAETREATIQNHIIQILMQNGGSIPMRELNKRMRPDRYGTGLWSNSYSGLIRNGWMAETGTGKTGDPKLLVLLQVPENEDD